ncbi:Solute carrier family 15 member 1 [Cucumispora dikerogammari]|nr:Solute carrier family 15 member 1 [Cucumispora dikerogammari]
MNNPRNLKYKLFTILICEFTERFYFYSIKSILYTHLTIYFSESIAKIFFHMFIITTFMSSILGFYIDNRRGTLKTINSSNCFYLVGGGIQLFSVSSYFDEENILGLYVFLGGLFMISIGTGGIKTNISNFAIDLIKEYYSIKQRGSSVNTEDDKVETQMSETTSVSGRTNLSTGCNNKNTEEHLEIQKFFVAFYFFINLGGFLGMIISPLFLSNKFLLFLIPFLLLSVSALIFYFTFKDFSGFPCERRCSVASGSYSTFNTIYSSKTTYTRETNEWIYKKIFLELLPIIRILLPISLFWMLYDQIASTFIQQSLQLNLYVSPLKLNIKREQMQSLNALFLLLLLPFYTRFQIKDTTKMILGMFLIFVSFLNAFILQLFIVIRKEEKLSILFQIPQFVFLSLAEILVAISGFEYLYKTSRMISLRSSKSLLLSLWYVNVALGNFYTIIVSYLLKTAGLQVELFVYCLLGLVGVVWLAVELRYISMFRVHN